MNPLLYRHNVTLIHPFLYTILHSFSRSYRHNLSRICNALSLSLSLPGAYSPHISKVQRKHKWSIKKKKIHTNNKAKTVQLGGGWPPRCGRIVVGLLEGNADYRSVESLNKTKQNHCAYKRTGKAAFGMGDTDYVQTQPIAQHVHTDREDKQEGQGSAFF